MRDVALQFFPKFRSTFGTTPTEYREHQMLSQVQFMLENSDIKPHGTRRF